MDLNKKQEHETTNPDNETSFIEMVFQYLKHWKWFVVSILICLCISLIYLRYSQRIYTIYSKVLIKDSQYGGGNSYDLNAFRDLGVTSLTSSIDNEIEVLNSESLMKVVVDSLNLQIEYYEKGRFKDREIYMQTPILVSISNQVDWGSFMLDKTEEGTYSIYSEELDFTQTFSLEEEVISPWGILRFKENPFGFNNYPIKVVIKHPQSRPYISISPANKYSTVIYIMLDTPTPQKGVDIINTLLHVYNRHTIREKNQAAFQTIEFIDERLSDISGELKTAEINVEAFKQEKGLTDIDKEGQLFISASNEYNKKISETETQQSILRMIKSYLLAPENKESLAPANLGLTDPTILSLMKIYNDEVLNKNTTTKGMTANNPVFKELEDRVALLKEELIKGIEISESGLQTTLQELRRQESRYIGKVVGLSAQEREWSELYRQKDIKETIFIYLLQKREETNLSLALSTPNAIIIDSATFSSIPVKPKSKFIILIGILIGIIIPFVIIYVKNMFDNKIRNKNQIEKIIKAPFLGEIPFAKTDMKFPVLKARSRIAEKFRIITTHLDFIANTNEKTKVVMITSTFSGEGKSFFSKNLAMSLATSGNKTLLIDFDMRKSMMKETLDMKPKKGIAMFLADFSINLIDIVDKSKYHEKLDIIPVKSFPPNPAELLISNRLDELFKELRSIGYDYIIVDTPPVGLVADAYRINDFVDATIFVTRTNYTFKSSLFEIQDLYKNQKLKNLTIVLNAAEDSPAYRANKHNYYIED